MSVSATRYDRYGWVLVCALPVFAGLLARGPIPIDETRYLSVAWDMWSKGDFLLPSLNGAPYTQKPPVLFWLMHLGWAIFGVNAWWPRCIPLLGALASVWLTRRLAARLYPEPDGVVADTTAWLLAGTLAWTAFTTLLLFDLVLVACVVAAIASLERVERAPVIGWCGYAAAVAAGLLTKGPATLVFALPPALLAPSWSVVAARRPARWYGGLVAALVVALGSAGAWAYAAYERAGAAFVHTLLWEQSATRIVHSFAHAEPWWFYLLAFPCLLFPWLLWPTAWSALRAQGDPRADRLALTTIIPAFVIFSLISGKQAQYLLPLVPLAILWLAPRVARPGTPLRGAALPAVLCVVLGVAILASAAASASLLAHAVTGAAALAGGLLFLRSGADRHAVVRRMAVASSVTVALIALAFFSTMGEVYQLHTTASVLRRLDEEGVPIAWIGPYDGQFNFLARLRHPLTVFARDEAAQVAAWGAAHADGRLVAYSRDARDFELAPDVHRQRYRSGWLAVLPASEAELAMRMTRSVRAGQNMDSD